MRFPYIIPPSQYPSVFFGYYFVPDGSKPIDTYIRCPIEWLVLETDKQRGRALLLSKYVLDWEGFANCPIFGSGYETSWYDSYLRLWLNDTFYKESFSSEEQDMILPVYNTAGHAGGKRAIDKVFLLSAEEIKKYFANEEAAVAMQMDLFSVSGSGSKDKPIELSFFKQVWWTRTLGTTKYLVKCVDWDGVLHEWDSNSNEIGVRPAMWVKL